IRASRALTYASIFLVLSILVILFSGACVSPAVPFSGSTAQRHPLRIVPATRSSKNVHGVCPCGSSGEDAAATQEYWTFH
ncbi:hypothetical protein C8R47DRAFT_1170894, partial [Mycena vitilis]